MLEAKVSAVIPAQREAVFDVVADLSLRPAWSGYMSEFRLARANPVGKGAAARYRMSRGLRSAWAGFTITECDRPRRIVETGQMGRLGRSKTVASYDFTAEAGGATRLEVTFSGEPKTFADRVMQAGGGRWMDRRLGTALDRLRKLFEEPGEGALERITVAGYDDYKAPRFGSHPSAERRTAVADG